MEKQPIYQRVLDTRQSSVSGIVFEYRGTSRKGELKKGMEEAK